MLEKMEKDNGKPIEEGGGRPPRKKAKTQPEKKKKTPRELRLDSFADSMDRSSSESSDDEEEPPKEVVPVEAIAPPQKKKKKFKPLLIPLSRTLTCPDMVRVDRCNRLPEYGPKILFFSGGSALRDVSSVLKNYTHHSIHLITPFDSGGSTAEIRKAYKIPAVGDLRNRYVVEDYFTTVELYFDLRQVCLLLYCDPFDRLIALSDQSALGNPAVIKFFAMR